MKRILGRLVRYKTFQKLAISYFLLVLLTLSMLSAVLFSLFSNSAVKEIDRNSKIMLSQISYASDVVYNQVMTIGNALIIEPQMVAFLNDTKEDKTQNYHVFRQLSQIKNAYPSLYSIGIYRPSTETNVDTSGLPFDKSLYGISNKQYMEFYPRELSASFINNSQPVKLLTFLLYPDYSLSSSANPLIYINVEENTILNTINKIDKGSFRNNVFVMNQEGRVLSHTDSKLFMKDLSPERYIQQILQENKPEDSFQTIIDNEKHLVTYVKSASMNWYFVSVTPYTKMISNIRDLRTVTLITAAGLALAGLLLSILLTRSMYKPMSSLYDLVKPRSAPSSSPVIDEYKVLTEMFLSLEENQRSMQFVINRSARTVREHYLQALLKGSTRNMDAPEEIIAMIDRQLTGPYFYTVVFKIDDMKAMAGRSSTEQSLLRFALCNIAKEILEPWGASDVLITEENEAVAVIQSGAGELPPGLKDGLRSVQDFMSRYFKLTVSAGIGDRFSGRRNIQYSYSSAQQYVKYRMIYGKQSILDQAEIRSHFTTVLNYPTAAEKKLTELLQSGKPEEIGEQVELFVGHVSAATCNQAVTYCIQLLLSQFKHFEYLGTNDASFFNKYLDAAAAVEAAESLEEITGIIRDFCFGIRSLIREKSQWLNAQKHNSVIEMVQAHIHDHYAEANLSLETVSQFAGLSSSYLGKLFKSTVEMSFSEYLSSTRLEKARELLLTTEETAFRISESVGMYNVSYFTTLFKKKYGVTPSMYRERAALKRINGSETDSSGE
ncbi:MAG: hypothetical protein K0R57_586 [Paenibacillaceae bacterium]|jgi:AraC-like DNA-binding protein|nr:hypothetical protein [Paenibacillaceae bacterium]